MGFEDFVNAILHGGTLTLSIFIMLLALSVVTWGVIIGKVIQLRREDQNSGKFVKAFNEEESLKKVDEALIYRKQTFWQKGDHQ